MKNACVDCGKPTGGVRCLKCHGQRERLTAAIEKSEEDAAYLQMRAEGLSYERIAARVGRGRQWAWLRTKKAKRRQELVKQGVLDLLP